MGKDLVLKMMGNQAIFKRIVYYDLHKTAQIFYSMFNSFHFYVTEQYNQLYRKLYIWLESFKLSFNIKMKFRFYARI